MQEGGHQASSPLVAGPNRRLAAAFNSEPHRRESDQARANTRAKARRWLGCAYRWLLKDHGVAGRQVVLGRGAWRRWLHVQVSLATV